MKISGNYSSTDSDRGSGGNRSSGSKNTVNNTTTSVVNMSKPETQEILSAFLDAELSNQEVTEVVDKLLKDPDYKAHYMRTQLVSDVTHEQMHPALLKNTVLESVAAQLEELPAYHVNDSELVQPKIEDVTRSSLFKTIMGHKLVSGLSVAASVMFVTLFTLQQFNNTTEGDIAGNSTGINVANTAIDNSYTPSLIQASAQLPATLVSGTGATISNRQLKQQYQWVEADPELARQVRQYLDDHEVHRAAYTLQPQIREASYQINE